MSRTPSKPNGYGLAAGGTKAKAKRAYTKPRPVTLEEKLRSLARFAELTADEPGVPTDGSCVVCGKQRLPERSVRYAHGCADIDPFCSSTCARAFHHTELPPPSYEYLHTRAGPPVCGTAAGYQHGCRCAACRGYMAHLGRLKRARERERKAAA